jgi:tripartite-type tricarboxylate transporter receptor subunit TctC
MLKKMPYDHLKDFTPISLYVKSPFVLVVNPSLPIRTVAELVSYAKERPGKLSYSSPGTSSALHLAFQMMNQQFGLDIVHVPYKSTPQSIADIVSGHVQMSFAEAGASQSLIRDGKLRALAVSSATRFGTLPDVLPFAEAGNVPDFEAVSWHVLVARAGTPREIVTKLHDEMQRIMKEPEVRERITNLGLIPFESPSVEGIQRYVAAEAEKWGAVVKKLGLEGTL